MTTICVKIRAASSGYRFLLVLAGVLYALAFVSRRVISQPVRMST